MVWIDKSGLLTFTQLSVILNTLGDGGTRQYKEVIWIQRVNFGLSNFDK